MLKIYPPTTLRDKTVAAGREMGKQKSGVCPKKQRREFCRGIVDLLAVGDDDVEGHNDVRDIRRDDTSRPCQ